MWRTLQYYITAVPNNTRPQKVFSVGWNLSFVYINQLFPLLPPCFAREIVLLNEQKIARTFSNDKGLFCWDGELYNGEAKWTMAEWIKS